MAKKKTKRKRPSYRLQTMEAVVYATPKATEACERLGCAYSLAWDFLYHSYLDGVRRRSRRYINRSNIKNFGPKANAQEV